MLDFDGTNAAALAELPDLVQQWLPDGKRVGREWISRNPMRSDRKPGSFKINLARGVWSDWAIGAGGSDPISLYAYLNNVGQGESGSRDMRNSG